MKINVYSEIGTLKKVLLHRPGKEIENLTPSLLERLLFDDICYLKVAQQEHDKFAAKLKDNGIDVVYIENLVSEALDQNPNLRNEFIEKFISEANIDSKWLDAYRKHITNMSNIDMVNEMIGGTMKIDLEPKNKDEDPFITEPLPNILFQRDPFASAGKGVILNHMWSVTRNRETLFAEFVFKNHREYNQDVSFWYQRDSKHHIEGGDVMVLNNKTLIVGISQRTTMDAVKELSKQILGNDSFEQIITIELPKSRAYMHLDTVLTNIDYDKFIAHPLIFDDIENFKMTRITIDKTEPINSDLEKMFSDVIGKKVTIIRCGGNDRIAAGREQWNDGTNVLTIKPGVVIAYERNWKTVELLGKAGVTVLTIPSSELSRGRGGPRCMSMPLIREEI